MTIAPPFPTLGPSKCVATIINVVTPVYVTAEDALAPPVRDGENSELANARDWLRELLAGNALSAKNVRWQASDAGYSWRTIERAKSVLGMNGRTIYSCRGFAIVRKVLFSAVESGSRQLARSL